MSEFSHNGVIPGHEVLLAGAEQQIAAYRATLDEAVTIGYPDRVGEDPETVFSPPPEVRQDAPIPQWSEEQQARMRALAANLGFGRETDLTFAAANLRDSHMVSEGGLAWKMRAQLHLLANEPDVQPRSVTLLASPHRLLRDNEKDFLQQQYPDADHALLRTEYDAARLLAARELGAAVSEKPEDALVLPYGYEATADCAPQEITTGQAIRIGYLTTDAPVDLLQVDHKFKDDKGRDIPPTPAELLSVVARMKGLLDNDQETPLALATSTTYQMNRYIAAVTASLDMGRRMGVVAYGTHTLARAKSLPGESPLLPQPPQINQLPGELHIAARAVRELDTIVKAGRQESQGQ